MNDPCITNEDAVQLIDFIDGVKRLAGGVNLEPTAKLSRLRAALADAAAIGGDIALVAEGKPKPAVPAALERTAPGERCRCGLVVAYGEIFHEDSPAHQRRMADLEHEAEYGIK